MEKIQFWGYLSSIATCISLILYVIGNLISGILAFIYSKRYNGEVFIWNPNNKILDNYFIIHDEEHNILNSSPDKLIIASESDLLNVKAFNICYKKRKFWDKYRFKKEGKIFSYNRLTPKECILLSTNIPEGIPNIRLEWETITYMKATLILNYNGRIGNIYERISYKRTIKSLIYCLFNK